MFATAPRLRSGSNSDVGTMLCRKIVDGLRGIPVVVGGVIPERDEPALLAMGVKRVFRMGTPFEEIVEWIKSSSRAASK